MTLLKSMKKNKKASTDCGNAWLRRYLIKGSIIYIIWEYNQQHGPVCRQWMIDGNDLTTMPCKYTGKLLRCDCSNGLSGIRPFEKEFIVYEFLCKPLGIPFKNGHPCSDFLQKHEVKMA